jgi:hypothetical protein
MESRLRLQNNLVVVFMHNLDDVFLLNLNRSIRFQLCVAVSKIARSTCPAVNYKHKPTIIATQINLSLINLAYKEHSKP